MRRVQRRGHSAAWQISLAIRSSIIRHTRYPTLSFAGGPNDPRARVYIESTRPFFDSGGQPWKRSLSPARPAVFITGAILPGPRPIPIPFDTLRAQITGRRTKGRNNRRICGRRRLRDRDGYTVHSSPLHLSASCTVRAADSPGRLGAWLEALEPTTMQFADS